LGAQLGDFVPVVPGFVPVSSFRITARFLVAPLSRSLVLASVNAQHIPSKLLGRHEIVLEAGKSTDPDEEFINRVLFANEVATRCANADIGRQAIPATWSNTGGGKPHTRAAVQGFTVSARFYARHSRPTALQVRAC
jgi:hypothetical protein